MDTGARLGLIVVLAAAFLGGCAGPSSGSDATATAQQSRSSLCPVGDGCTTTPFGPLAPAEPAALTCPVGASTIDGACEVSYDVAAADFDGAEAQCGGQIHNGCRSTPIAFHWNDGAGRAPISVRVALRTAVFCPDGDDRVQRLSLNGGANVIGSYEGALADCVCPAIATDREFDLSADALTAYAPGAVNTVTVGGSNRCLGMDANAGWGGAYARVTVRY